jgi:hypothetical protein
MGDNGKNIGEWWKTQGEKMRCLSVCTKMAPERDYSNDIKSDRIKNLKQLGNKK